MPLTTDSTDNLFKNKYTTAIQLLTAMTYGSDNPIFCTLMNEFQIDDVLHVKESHDPLTIKLYNYGHTRMACIRLIRAKYHRNFLPRANIFTSFISAVAAYKNKAPILLDKYVLLLGNLNFDAVYSENIEESNHVKKPTGLSVSCYAALTAFMDLYVQLSDIDTELDMEIIIECMRKVKVSSCSRDIFGMLMKRIEII